MKKHSYFFLLLSLGELFSLKNQLLSRDDVNAFNAPEASSSIHSLTSFHEPALSLSLSRYIHRTRPEAP